PPGCGHQTKTTFWVRPPRTSGRLVLGASPPAGPLLDAQGTRFFGGDPPILDHRSNDSKFRLARDSSSLEFGFNVWADGKWHRRLARFDLRERRLALDVTPDNTPSLPRTDGLDIRDWGNNYNPTLDG